MIRAGGIIGVTPAAASTTTTTVDAVGHEAFLVAERWIPDSRRWKGWRRRVRGFAVSFALGSSSLLGFLSFYLTHEGQRALDFGAPLGALHDDGRALVLSGGQRSLLAVVAAVTLRPAAAAIEVPRAVPRRRLVSPRLP